MHALWNIYFDICKWNAWESMALHKAEFVIKFAIRLPPPPPPAPLLHIVGSIVSLSITVRIDLQDNIAVDYFRVVFSVLTSLQISSAVTAMSSQDAGNQATKNFNIFKTCSAIC